MKKVGKTTRPFKYDLNQIPCDYTVEVRNRFKGLDLIDRVPDELWTEVRDIVQETGIKTIPMEKKCKKAKWLSGEALQIAVKSREANWENGIVTCIISYKKCITSPGSIQDTWGCCIGMIQKDGIEREVGGGFRIGNMCTPVAD